MVYLVNFRYRNVDVQWVIEIRVTLLDEVLVFTLLSNSFLSNFVECCVPCRSNLPLDILNQIEVITTMIVLVSVAVQSLFGVGVMVLGTPLLMLAGLPFLEVLGVLLPVSLSINTLQVFVGWKHIQWRHVQSFLIFALPTTVVGTVFLKFLVGFSFLPMLIALYLLVVTIGFYFQAFPNLVIRFLSRDKLYLGFMGLVHGLTNLGGPLLSAYVMAKFNDKQQSRATTAICYALLVVVQIITLTFSGFKLYPSLQTGVVLFWAMLVFLAMNQWVFLRLTNQKFKTIFGVVLLLISMLLIAKQFV